MSILDRLPDEMVYAILARLSTRKTVELAETTSEFRRFDDWEFIMRLKYPGIKWPYPLSADDAIAADDALTECTDHRFAELIERSLTGAAIAIVEHAKQLYTDDIYLYNALGIAAYHGNFEVIDAILNMDPRLNVCGNSSLVIEFHPGLGTADRPLQSIHVTIACAVAAANDQHDVVAYLSALACVNDNQWSDDGSVTLRTCENDRLSTHSYHVPYNCTYVDAIINLMDLPTCTCINW